MHDRPALVRHRLLGSRWSKRSSSGTLIAPGKWRLAIDTPRPAPSTSQRQPVVGQPLVQFVSGSSSHYLAPGIAFLVASPRTGKSPQGVSSKRCGAASAVGLTDCGNTVPSLTLSLVSFHIRRSVRQTATRPNGPSRYHSGSPCSVRKLPSLIRSRASSIASSICS